ncbi:MAG: sugar phosphate nucleotidyltransferase [Patescibacteria group bacterium]|jgi:D-glycero-alpha-D-manno-heptose 1-phosphate guanylyltransferase
MNAVILCGGLSTRLGEITKTIPKILLEIKGRTVLEWQIEKLKKIGITEVVLAAGHLSEVLFKTVGVNCNGVTLTYAIEESKLGTGGAIKHAWNYFGDNKKPVFILNGDILTAVDYAEMVKELKPESDGVILGAKVEDASSYGTLRYEKDGHLKEFKEKEGLHEPGYINGGIYLFNQRVTKYFPSESSFSVEYDVFPKMKNLFVYTSDQAWIDIGVPERLEWARKNWDEKI